MASKRKYEGPLGRRSAPRISAVDRTAGEIDKLKARLFDHEMRGLDLLCDHHGIEEKDPAVRYMLLSLALAREYVPWFRQPGAKRGTKADPIRPALLILDVELAKRRGATSDRQAVSEIQGRNHDEWVAYDVDSLTRMLRRARRGSNPLAKIIIRLLAENRPSDQHLEALRTSLSSS